MGKSNSTLKPKTRSAPMTPPPKPSGISEEDYEIIGEPDAASTPKRKGKEEGKGDESLRESFVVVEKEDGGDEWGVIGREDDENEFAMIGKEDGYESEGGGGLEGWNVVGEVGGKVDGRWGGGDGVGGKGDVKKEGKNVDWW